MIDQFQNQPWAVQSDSFGALATDWAANDGKAAASWALGLTEQARKQALPRAIGTWGKENPEAAATWLKTQKLDPAMNARLQGEFLRQIQVSRPEEYYRWASQFQMLSN